MRANIKEWASAYVKIILLIQEKPNAKNVIIHVLNVKNPSTCQNVFPVIIKIIIENLSEKKELVFVIVKKGLLIKDLIFAVIIRVRLVVVLIVV